MKTVELMIGDFFLYKGNVVEIVSIDGGTETVWIDSEKISALRKVDDLQPIHLTQEILEKNGMNSFDIDKLTEKATAKWWHKRGDFFIKQYHFKHRNFKPTYSFGCNNHTLIEGIEYVHELQHALKLCKINKELIL